MKLHLILDSEIYPSSSEQSIFLLSLHNTRKDLHGNVEYVNMTMDGDNPAAAMQLSEEIGHFHPEFRKISNSVYDKFYKPVYMYIANISYLIRKYNIDELILYEGCDEPFFLGEGGEGEGRGRGYKTNWMINPLVEGFFADTCKISWVGKGRNTTYRTKSALFKTKILVSFVLKRIFSRLKTFRLRNIPLVKEQSIVSIISLNLQKEHLNKLIRHTTGRNIVFFSYNYTLVDSKETFYIPDLPIFTLLKMVFETLAMVGRSTSIKILRHDSYSLPHDFCFLLLKYRVLEERAYRFINKHITSKNVLMVSNTTWGADMVSIHEVSKKLGLHHINFQYVSMAKVFCPNVELADEYYLYSKKTYDFYRGINDSFKLYFPLYSCEEEKYNKSTKLVFTVFTQPEGFRYDYFNYLDDLVPQLYENGLEIELVIKPHYREKSLEDYNKYLKYNFVRLAQPCETCSELLKVSHLSMSITSSVIFESMTYGVPCIVYNPNHKFDQDIYEEDICYPEVNFVIENPSQSLDILKQYKKKKEEFDKRLNDYAQELNAVMDIRSIIDKATAVR